MANQVKMYQHFLVTFSQILLAYKLFRLKRLIYETVQEVTTASLSEYTKI